MDSVINLPIGDGSGDPNRPSVSEALEVLDDADAAGTFSPAEKLLRMAGTNGDISHIFSAAKLAEIGERCVASYERDKSDRQPWEDTAREAIAACSQEEVEKASGLKDYPWPGAANMKWPLLTIASMQFNARMYPAVIKGDEAVLCKVIGNDDGRPVMAPNPQSGEIQPVPELDPQTGQPPVDAQGQPVIRPQWDVEPGAKTKRARRVAEYLNTVLFYRMDNWESDTDALLMQLPAVGCHFRKVWPDENGQSCSATISALDIIVPKNTRSLKGALRITERLNDIYPHEILASMQAGHYRSDAALQTALQVTDTNQNDGARLLLEQHCLWDFDDDGLPEPYVVTLDHATRTVLRIEPNFSPDNIVWKGGAQTGTPIKIERRTSDVKYGLFPHPGGNFYDIGLGHLLKKMGDGVDTMLNQLIDAGTAQTAGGGFIGSGVRLQNRGARGQVRFTPGAYNTVDVPGDQLRNSIVEMTRPQVSPVTFQVLELILGAARDIAGIKDVMTGEASNQGQVGTTLALIEQGLQVFNATAKRIFRALKAEYELLFETICLFGGELSAADYQETLDDPEADFAADFTLKGLDIRPVSDPASITRMQKMAKAQFTLNLLPTIAQVGGDAREVVRRVLEAVDTEDIEKVLPPPQAPDPRMMLMQLQQMQLTLQKLAADIGKTQGDTVAANAKALRDAAEAQQTREETARGAAQHGMEMGALAALTNGTPINGATQ
jgi:chaperonin GroES